MEWSKNYYLKIPVRVRVRVCMRVHMIVRTPQDTRPRPDQIRSDQDTTRHGTPPEQRGTQDYDQHTNGTQDTSGKGRNTSKAEKPAYVGINAGTKKKYKKS